MKLAPPLGFRIRMFRTRHNLSRSQLAALTGVTTDYIARCERSALRPGETWLRYLSALESGYRPPDWPVVRRMPDPATAPALRPVRRSVVDVPCETPVDRGESPG